MVNINAIIAFYKTAQDICISKILIRILGPPPSLVILVPVQSFLVESNHYLRDPEVCLLGQVRCKESLQA